LLHEHLQLCCELRPDVAIVDAGYPDNAAFEIASELILKKWTRGVLILDSEVRISRVLKAQELNSVSYYSKRADLTEVLEAIRMLCRGEESFDPSIRDRIIYDRHGRPKHLRIDEQSVANLTKRELQVMKLLAEGHAGGKVAQFMQISPSTVDNHKSRLMKKLNVHKISHLTLIAIREGLVDSSD